MLKNRGMIIFLIIIILLLVCAVIFVPKLFPKNNSAGDVDSSVVTSKASSVAPKQYTLSEMISESDNAVLGTVIKADVDENGVLYTCTVSWSDVYKGRNYATMGYAYVTGAKQLEFNKTYLFIGDTNEEKYHYIEPFENAPWVFEVGDDESLKHVSNGDVKLVTDLSEITLEKVKNICESQASSK